jgi:hypothetical protein
MSCCALQLFFRPTCQRQRSGICKWDHGIRVYSFANHRILYTVLGYLYRKSLASPGRLRRTRTYPNSPTTALYRLHLRGEAVLLLVTIDIGSHGRVVMLLTIGAARDERTNLSGPYKWRLMGLHASERLNRKWWRRVSAITSGAIPRQEVVAVIAMGCREIRLILKLMSRCLLQS